MGRLTPNSDAICATVCFALAVRRGLVVHLPGELDLAGTKLRLLPAGASPGAGGREPVGHQRVLEFCDRSERMWKNIRPTAVEVIDPLVEHDEVDAAFLEQL